MPPKLLRNLLLAPVILLILFEAAAWIFFPFPVEPLRTVDLNNDIPGFKKNVRLIFGDDQVRYLDWTAGDKPEGVTRILCIGGLATQGMLQGAGDTWWGQLHSRLKAQGLKVQTAARGFDSAGIVAMAAGMPVVVARLKPDVIILNSGFDDVIIHSAAYTYDKDKLSKLPAPPQPSSIKNFLTKISQTVRFKRWLSKDSEAKRNQNEMGRTDVFKRFFDEKRKSIQNLPRHEGILRRGSANDPLNEYLDGLAAFRAMAAKNGAALVLTGEASFHDSVMNLTSESLLLAYIALREPDSKGEVTAARPNPAWVMHEMERFADAAAKFAAEHKLPWIDLNGKVGRSTDNFYSDVILTDAGAVAAAEILAPVVAPAIRPK